MTKVSDLDTLFSGHPVRDIVPKMVVIAVAIGLALYLAGAI